MIDASAVPLPIAIACLVATVMLFAGLRGIADAGGRANVLLCVGAITLAGGGTISIHDVSALPKILGAILAGGLAGFFLPGGLAIGGALLLIALFEAFIGLALVLLGGAALHNPAALGLGDGFTTPVSTGARAGIAAAAAIGALVLGGASMTGLRLALRRDVSVAIPGRDVLTCILVGLGGWLLGRFVLSGTFLSRDSLDVAAGMALCLGAGALATSDLERARVPVLLAGMAACSGWAAALFGFALSNSFLVGAGGLVGAAGASLAFTLMPSRV